LIGLSSAAKDSEICNNPFQFLHPSKKMSKYLQEPLDDNFDIMFLPFITMHKLSNTGLLVDLKNS
jgi:hypothetical protein